MNCHISVIIDNKLKGIAFISNLCEFLRIVSAIIATPVRQSSPHHTKLWKHGINHVSKQLLTLDYCCIQAALVLSVRIQWPPSLWMSRTPWRGCSCSIQSNTRQPLTLRNRFLRRSLCWCCQLTDPSKCPQLQSHRQHCWAAAIRKDV